MLGHDLDCLTSVVYPVFEFPRRKEHLFVLLPSQATGVGQILGLSRERSDPGHVGRRGVPFRVMYVPPPRPWALGNVEEPERACRLRRLDHVWCIEIVPPRIEGSLAASPGRPGIRNRCPASPEPDRSGIFRGTGYQIKSTGRQMWDIALPYYSTPQHLSRGFGNDKQLRCKPGTESAEAQRQDRHPKSTTL